MPLLMINKLDIPQLLLHIRWPFNTANALNPLRMWSFLLLCWKYEPVIRSLSDNHRWRVLLLRGIAGISSHF